MSTHDEANRIAGLPKALVLQALECADHYPHWSDGYKKFPELFDRLRNYDIDIGHAVDDLNDVIEWLREEGQYDKSDRLRTIAGRLARAARHKTIIGEVVPIRDIARGWK